MSLHDILQLSPTAFEQFCRTVLQNCGYTEVQVTQASRDGGIDGTATAMAGIARIRVAFQCKRWEQPVGRPEIDRFRGAIQGDYQQGLFITTSTYSAEAINTAERPGVVPIVLVDGERLLTLSQVSGPTQSELAGIIAAIGGGARKDTRPLKWTNKCIMYERNGVMYTSRMCFSIQTPGGEPFRYEDVALFKPRPKPEHKESSWWSTPFSPR